VTAKLCKILIRAHWPEILRVAASIRTGTVKASRLQLPSLKKGEETANFHVSTTP
jgi:Tn3 transposase DDE domain